MKIQLKTLFEKILFAVFIGFGLLILFFIGQAFYYSKFHTKANTCPSISYKAKVIARWSVKRYNNTFYKFSYKGKELETRSWKSDSKFAKTVRLDDSVYKFINSDSCYLVRQGKFFKIGFCE